MERAYAKDVIGKCVATSDGIEIGDVIDIELDIESWEVAWLVIRLDRAVAHRFHVQVPYVMGTKAILLKPQNVRSISLQQLQLRTSIEQTVFEAVIAFDTDATEHIGRHR